MYSSIYFVSQAVLQPENLHLPFIQFHNNENQIQEYFW
jgi:hypothetical protein